MSTRTNGSAAAGWTVRLLVLTVCLISLCVTSQASVECSLRLRVVDGLGQTAVGDPSLPSSSFRYETAAKWVQCLDKAINAPAFPPVSMMISAFVNETVPRRRQIDGKCPSRPPTCSPQCVLQSLSSPVLVCPQNKMIVIHIALLFNLRATSALPSGHVHLVVAHSTHLAECRCGRHIPALPSLPGCSANQLPGRVAERGTQPHNQRLIHPGKHSTHSYMHGMRPLQGRHSPMTSLAFMIVPSYSCLAYM